MMLLRVRSLALGRSGVRPLVAAGAGRPAQRRHHPVGAGARLARRVRRPGPAGALRAGAARRGLGARPRTASGSTPPTRCARGRAAPIELAAKEGLALINGTDGMLGMLLLADRRRRGTCSPWPTSPPRWRSRRCSARTGRSCPSCTPSGRTRARPPRRRTSTGCCQDSRIMDSHRDDLAHAVQDAYSMRCAPQVAGAARDTLDFVDEVAGRELISVVDNPVVLPDGRVESTGNFHGAPLGFAADYLAIAARRGRGDRRTPGRPAARRDPSRDLPPFLSPDAGVNSGLMIAQYTAAGHRRGEPSAGRARLGRLAADQSACRRTTSRWAGRRPRSCAPCWTT